MRSLTVDETRPAAGPPKVRDLTGRMTARTDLQIAAAYLRHRKVVLALMRMERAALLLLEPR